jgi:hypothetical protein
MISDALRARLVEHQPALLCLDSCALLDVMRTPVRTGAPAHERAAALGILERIEQGQVVCFFAEQANLEFAEHVDAVAAEAETELARLRGTVDQVNAVISALGQQAASDLDHFAAHGQLARAVVDRYRAHMIALVPADDVTARAFARVNHARTPARKGKESMKDCVVIETYLEAVRILRDEGYARPAVFASSNTKGYVGNGTTQLKADLAGEFAALSIEYAPNLGAASHLLGN